MELLNGQAAVITGGAQGIGLGIAQAFIEHGATSIVIADSNVEAARSVAKRLATAEVLVEAIQCDVTSESEVANLVSRAVELFGSIDIMVNNAGVTRDAGMHRMTLDDFRVVVDVSLQGAWLGTRAAAAVMRDVGRGSILNMSSISGKVGNAGQTNYSAAKAGMIGLTKAAAKELAPFGVRVNAIQPGLIRTAMTAAMKPEVWEQRMTEIPLGRAGEIRDVANVAVFLASPLSSYMTGTVLEVAGGRHL